ncbi:MAG TPA: MerR family transcriptional regulator [Coleofasciculaceae cyanobacterium]
METELTIQQVAAKTGLSVHTLRYYERNGLLEPVNRATNGHRRYATTDVLRIEFLTRLRSTGMPIRQMQQFANLLQDHPESIGDRKAILEAHQRNVEQHIQELQQNLAAIQQKIRFYTELEQRAHTDPTFVTPPDDRMLCLAWEQFCQAEKIAPAQVERLSQLLHQSRSAGVSQATL